MENLTAKAKTGAFWVISEQAASYVFSFTANIVLARLLFPKDFGVVAIALVAWEIIKLFGNFGIAAKLIHQQEQTDEYANSAFWLNIMASLILAAATALVAPYIALFYGNESVGPILMLLSLAFFIQSFGTTHLALLRKDLAFKRIAIIELATTFLSKSIAVGMAFAGFGPWSLVVPEAVISPVKALAYWIANPWRPSLRFDTRYWKDILNFGFNYLGADLMRYLSVNGDYVVIGKMLGERSLGLYTFAYNIANLPFQSVTSTVTKVAFPTFSKLQNNLDRFRTVLLKMTKFTSLIAFPLLVELLVLADLIIPLVYGEKWRPSILPLQIIIVFVLFRVFTSPGGQVLFAVGKPNVLFKFNLIQAPFLLAGVYIGSYYGIVGAAIGMSGVLIVGSLFLAYIFTQPIGLSVGDVLRVIIPATASSAFMAVALEVLKGILLGSGMKNYFALAILLPAGIGVYFLVLLLFFRDDFRFLWNLAWESVIERLPGMSKKPTLTQSV